MRKRDGALKALPGWPGRWAFSFARAAARRLVRGWLLFTASRSGNRVAASVVQQIRDTRCTRMEHTGFRHRFNGAVVVAQPIREARVVRIDDVVTLRGVFAIVIDDGKQSVLLLLLIVLLGGHNFYRTIKQ